MLASDSECERLGASATRSVSDRDSERRTLRGDSPGRAMNLNRRSPKGVTRILPGRPTPGPSPGRRRAKTEPCLEGRAGAWRGRAGGAGVKPHFHSDRVKKLGRRFDFLSRDFVFFAVVL